MRKLAIPYTIQRNGIYYLNVRWKNEIIRQSLATKEPLEALKRVNDLSFVLKHAKDIKKELHQRLIQIKKPSINKLNQGFASRHNFDPVFTISMAFEVYLNEHSVENWSLRTRQQQESTKD